MGFRFWGPWRVEEALQGELDLNLIDKRGVGALHWCIDKDCLEYFDRLLAAGADPNLPTDHFLNTLLHYAVCSPNGLYTRGLLRVGADPNRADKDGRTPLFDAIREDNLGAVRLLLEHGADTAVVARGKQTPYGSALLSGRVEIARLLQSLPMGTTRTPTDWLYVAAREKLWRIIPHLAGRGAELLGKDKYGRTPLELAAEDLYGFSGSGDAEYQEDKKRTIEAIRAGSA